MADTVQVLMEKMIPELEDLQERKLFSKVTTEPASDVLHATACPRPHTTCMVLLLCATGRTRSTRS